jgi:hypothetical protein
MPGNVNSSAAFSLQKQITLVLKVREKATWLLEILMQGNVTNGVYFTAQHTLESCKRETKKRAFICL